MAYGIIPMVGASLIADLLKEAREVATPSASYRAIKLEYIWSKRVRSA